MFVYQVNYKVDNGMERYTTQSSIISKYKLSETDLLLTLYKKYFHNDDIVHIIDIKEYTDQNVGMPKILD